MLPLFYFGVFFILFFGSALVADPIKKLWLKLCYSCMSDENLAIEHQNNLNEHNRWDYDVSHSLEPYDKARFDELNLIEAEAKSRGLALAS